VVLAVHWPRVKIPTRMASSRVMWSTVAPETARAGRYLPQEPTQQAACDLVGPAEHLPAHHPLSVGARDLLGRLHVS
jgi:hypothetical protein